LAALSQTATGSFPSRSGFVFKRGWPPHRLAGELLPDRALDASLGLQPEGTRGRAAGKRMAQSAVVFAPSLRRLGRTPNLLIRATGEPKWIAGPTMR
jgi:hypothetical protein